MTTALLVLVIISLLIDAKQTLNIKKLPQLHEINPVLGPHPSDALVVVYFAAWITACLAGYLYLPWQFFTGVSVPLIALELYTINNNRKLGM